MDANAAPQQNQVQLRYRKLLENLPGCIVFVLDQDLRATFAGGGLVAHAAFRPQIYFDRPLADFVAPGVFAYAEPYLLATLAGAETSFALDLPSGSSFEIRTTPLQEDQGRAAEILVIALETTQRKRAEAAELAAQQALQLAVQATHIGLWDVDLQTNRVHYSREWKQQLGYGNEEIGDSLDEWERRLHPADLEPARSLVAAYLAAPWPNFEQEFRLRHKDGSYRWILARGTAHYDAEGKPLRMLGVHIDLTERKQAEEALRESEAVLKRSQAVAHIGHWSVDKHRHTVTWSEELKNILGLDPTLPCNLDEALRRAIHPDDVAHVRELRAQLRNVEGAVDVEFRILRPDGTVRYLRAMADAPERDGEGNILRRTGVMQDVTERKLRELENELLLHRLQSTAEQLAQVVVSAPDAVLLLDNLGNVLLTNPKADTLLGQQATYDDEGRLRQLAGAEWKELQAEPPPGHWHTLRAGQQVLEAIARPTDTGVVVSGWTVIVRDVTIERAAREQMQRQEQLAAVGQLAAGIAHDFNNIMSVISVYAEMTSEAQGLTEKERARTLTIVEQTQRAARMIRQILDFSRQAVYERQPLDLLPLLKEEAKLLRQTLPESIEVKLDAAPGEYVVLADPTRIQQMVMNLALNARDAMPDGGMLNVGLGHIIAGERTPVPGLGAGAWVQISVSDTGAGIRPEHLAHIFEPFFTTKEAGRGTGLGLAQVQGIVAQHEGHIAVASEPGTGTIFTIYLPAVITHIPEEAEPPVPLLPEGRGECVLLVEDDEAVRSSMAALLEGWNYRVVQAANGQEALVCLARPWQQVDVILSDVVMPRLGGVGLVKALRKDGVTTPVILMSGYVEGGARAGLKGAGVLAWLDKPPSSAALAGAIATAVGGG
ncbi:MAG: PAS domain-containing protein [Caldilineaceae bacterium]